MLWLLGEETTGLSDLLKIGGSIGGTASIFVLAKIAYRLWRKWKDDKNKDDENELKLEIKRDEAQLNLSIKEEEQIEAQLQRVINQQDALITKQQTRIDGMQESLNEYIAKLSAETTKNSFLRKQLADEEKYMSQLREERDIARKKYYTLKNGIKPDSDVEPPTTEIAPEKA